MVAAQAVPEDPDPHEGSGAPRSPFDAPPERERSAVNRKERLQLAPHIPEKQSPAERVTNWSETFHLFDAETAKAEALRCIQCPAAPCQVACPVHNDIPAALWQLEQGDFSGAAEIFRETSELPEMCGRLCPQERLCEGHCVVGKKGVPVSIGKLEAFTTEWQRANDHQPIRALSTTGKRVAIIGAGPAGIAAGERLARAGHAIVMFDEWPLPGGLLHYGIPTFKQNKAAVEAKFADLRALGIEVRLGVHVGRDVAFAALEEEFDAVFIGVGAPAGARLGFEHEDAPGVFTATDFLVRANLPPEDLPESMRAPLPELQRALVVGGGDPSMDCVRSAIRLGAREVRLIYRRTQEEMQGRDEERKHAVEEGVIFEYLTSPLAIAVDAKGAFNGLRCERMTLGRPDESGRRRPEPIEGSEFLLEADALVTAIGYNVDEEWGEIVPDLARDSWGRLTVDPETMRTSRRGVFAGGDDVNGADLVVTALADGQRAAAAIDAYLRDGSW